MEEKRPVLKKIDINSFYEEPNSSEQTGRPFETNAIQTRSSEHKKNQEHMNERSDLSTRMTLLMTVVKHVLLMKAKRSTMKLKHFVKEPKIRS